MASGKQQAANQRTLSRSLAKRARMQPTHVYEIRPQTHRGVDLISDVLPWRVCMPIRVDQHALVKPSIAAGHMMPDSRFDEART